MVQWIQPLHVVRIGNLQHRGQYVAHEHCHVLIVLDTVRAETVHDQNVARIEILMRRIPWHRLRGRIARLSGRPACALRPALTGGGRRGQAPVVGACRLGLFQSPTTSRRGFLGRWHHWAGRSVEVGSFHTPRPLGNGDVEVTVVERNEQAPMSDQCVSTRQAQLGA